MLKKFFSGLNHWFTEPAAPAAGTDSARRRSIRQLGLALGGGLLAVPALGGTRSPERVNGSEPYLGELMLFAGNFEVRGWAFCNGQILSITQNTALFSILGTTYGGDGRNTFALPDLRGRTPIHFGQGPGLSSHLLGEVSGSETVTLVNSQQPNHNHGLNVSSSAGTSATPVGNVPAVAATAANVNGEVLAVNAYGPSADAAAAAEAIGLTGGGQPANNMPPYLALNWQIAVEGIFPTRN